MLTQCHVRLALYPNARPLCIPKKTNRSWRGGHNRILAQYCAWRNLLLTCVFHLAVTQHRRSKSGFVNRRFRFNVNPEPLNPEPVNGYPGFNHFEPLLLQNLLVSKNEVTSFELIPQAYPYAIAGSQITNCGHMATINKPISCKMIKGTTPL